MDSTGRMEDGKKKEGTSTGYKTIRCWQYLIEILYSIFDTI